MLLRLIPNSRNITTNLSDFKLIRYPFQKCDGNKQKQPNTYYRKWFVVSATH